MNAYIALLHPEEDGGYSVSFPDFPGCASQGETLDEAAEMAQEALEGHVECLLEDGQPLPTPTDLAAIRARPGNREVLPVVVRVPGQTPRYVRVSITVPEPDLRRIDAYAKAHGFPRSSFLVQAARQAMQE